MGELMLIRYGSGTQIVEVSGRTRTGKIQLVARYSVIRGAGGKVFVERKTTSAKVDAREVIGDGAQDWRRSYVQKHSKCLADRVTGPGYDGRDVTVHCAP